MKFARFKEETPKVRVPLNLEVLTGYKSEFNEADEITRLQLAWGNCATCGQRVTAEVHHKQVGVTWYTCTQDPNHLWEVDYVSHIITPYLDR